MDTTKTIICNDFHGQFCDKLACNLLFSFIKREKPNKVIINGDLVDFYSISRFDKDPGRKELLQDEIDECFNLMVDIRNSAPDAEIILIEGNHEARLRKYLRSKAPALATLKVLQIESLLDLAKLDITYEEDGVWLGDLFVYHGSLVRSKAGYTAHAELLKNGCSGISGHTHRDGKAPVRHRGGQLCWWENFCLCDLNPEYVKGIANWTQGWSVVTTKNTRPCVEQIAVMGGRYTYRGKEYKEK